MDVLTALLVLACPVGMALMMWVMMRGHGKNDRDMGSETNAEVARLHAEVDQLRAAQRDDDSAPHDAGVQHLTHQLGRARRDP